MPLSLAVHSEITSRGKVGAAEGLRRPKDWYPNDTCECVGVGLCACVLGGGGVKGE